ncbi:MAG: spore germination protein GerW family protein [Candidatus Cloacimonadota bacterium]|nr:spore germination protein GerW family protein [Candidatus Cloacimonadota bacterium]
MAKKELLSKISENLQKGLNIELVFGEIKEVKNRQILPVSTVAYGLGGGNSKQEEDDSAQGGGGGLTNRPLGIFEFDDVETRFKPVYSFKQILILLGMLLLFWSKILKSK